MLLWLLVLLSIFQGIGVRTYMYGQSSHVKANIFSINGSPNLLKVWGFTQIPLASKSAATEPKPKATAITVNL